jgi:hypothetical protein
MTMVEDAVELLREISRKPDCWLYGTRFEPGLTSSELARAEDSFGFTFGPDHREFLTNVLPRGRWWPNWREAEGRHTVDILSALGRWLLLACLACRSRGSCVLGAPDGCRLLR